MEKEIYMGILADRHRRFLQTHHKRIYINLITTGQIDDYLMEVEERAQELRDRLTEQYKKKWGVTEELKANDMMKWVGLMNNINACVMEIVNKEVIYSV